MILWTQMKNLNEGRLLWKLQQITLLLFSHSVHAIVLTFKNENLKVTKKDVQWHQKHKKNVLISTLRFLHLQSQIYSMSLTGSLLSLSGPRIWQCTYRACVSARSFSCAPNALFVLGFVCFGRSRASALCSICARNKLTWPRDVWSHQPNWIME